MHTRYLHTHLGLGAWIGNLLVTCATDVAYFRLRWHQLLIAITLMRFRERETERMFGLMSLPPPNQKHVSTTESSFTFRAFVSWARVHNYYSHGGVARASCGTANFWQRATCAAVGPNWFSFPMEWSEFCMRVNTQTVPQTWIWSSAAYVLDGESTPR